ncbi:hypothetical protein BDV93DRAFT_547719 [Ceratobasidium sp. AG-I]|nr:hypothetical protein BDV93DRAFT_547719 [Ceratobasidium sp. AG-I]
MALHSHALCITHSCALAMTLLASNRFFGLIVVAIPVNLPSNAPPSKSGRRITPATKNSTYTDEFVYVYQSANRHRTLGYPNHMDLNPVIHFTSLGAAFTFIGGRTRFVRNAGTKASHHLNLGNESESGLGAFGDPNEYSAVRLFYSDKRLTIFSATPFSRQESPHPGFGGISNVSANSTFNPQEVANLLAQPEGMDSAIHGSMGGQDFTHFSSFKMIWNNCEQRFIWAMPRGLGGYECFPN